jgi:hypothetical protein
MTTLNYPSGIYVPNAGTFQLISNTSVFVSPLTGSTQTSERPGSRWSAEIEYFALSESDARTLIAFLTQLRGMSGRFYYGDPFNRTPRGLATGTPLINGASQTGTSLITDGWTPNITNILRAGDYIQLANDELKMVVADVNSDGSGNATLTIEPPLRSSPANNSAIIVQDPKCVMRLIDDEQTQWAYNKLSSASIKLKMIESFI